MTITISAIPTDLSTHEAAKAAGRVIHKTHTAILTEFVESAKVGDPIMVHAFGHWYLGKIHKFGRKNVHCEYTTGTGTTRVKSCRLGYIKPVRVIPALEALEDLAHSMQSLYYDLELAEANGSCNRLEQSKSEALKKIQDFNDTFAKAQPQPEAQEEAQPEAQEEPQEEVQPAADIQQAACESAQQIIADLQTQAEDAKAAAQALEALLADQSFECSMADRLADCLAEAKAVADGIQRILENAVAAYDAATSGTDDAPAPVVTKVATTIQQAMFHAPTNRW